MNQRPYGGAADLRLLQAFNAAAIAATDHCGYLHPGDIPHRIYNGNRRHDPVDLLTIWEDGRGVAAWLLVGPGHRSFDAQVRPDLRGGSLEREVLELGAERTAVLMRRHAIPGDQLLADAFRCDSARRDLLVALGWARDDSPPYVLNRRAITAVSVPSLPEGFTYRAATGTEDAAALAAVHSGAFGSSWTADSYRRLMGSPGYDPARELVIVAPDGAFAAFTIIWFDHLNGIGSFEPVGAHRDYQRRGLGRALLHYGLAQMAAAGMRVATVATFGDNEAALGLYQACGFTSWHMLDGYHKAL